MPQRRKPTHLKIVEGNPGKRKINPEPLGNGLPTVPPHFDEEHRELWQKLVDETPVGVLSGSDNMILEALTVSWHRYRQATKEIMDQGAIIVDKDGARRRNPYLMIQSKALEEMNALGGQMGLSPIARQKLNMDPRDPSYVDPMEAILSADFAKYSQYK